MRTYDLHSQTGELLAFEVSSLLGVSGAARILEGLPRVRVVERQRLFRGLRDEEIRIRFEYEGERFTVEEPFGDSSRFWVGPESRTPTPRLDPIREAFARARWWGFSSSAVP
jgi:hypothetical protein